MSAEAGRGRLSSQTPVESAAERASSLKRRRASGPRGRSGCLTCRNRKKKCDGSWPVCDACKRLNYSCLREEPRALPPRAHTWKNPPRVLKHRTLEAVSETPSESSDLQLCRTPNASGVPENDSVGMPIASARKEMLRYYIQTFSIMLTTNLENNCFLSVFLPMAMDSPTLLNAILAWSASHLSLRDASYKETALQLRGISLNSLSSTISPPSGKPDLEVALSSCLVLCGMESILGDNERWYQHLAGAFEVIRSSTSLEVGEDSALVPTGFLATTDGRWLLRNFAYHDVVMSVTCQRRPLLPGNYWANPDESTVDSYFGLASHLMYLTSEISVLSADMSEMADFVHVDNVPTSTANIDHNLVEPIFDTYCLLKSPPESKVTFSARAHMLESQLLQWQCAPSPSPSLVSLAEAYRLAALIHLYRTLRLHLPELCATLDFKIAQVVENMVECLETMPPGCLPESGLLFPLFIAGGEARETSHIAVIRKRMLDIVESRHFANVTQALDVLDELWQLRASSRLQTFDWADILKKRNWKLALT